MGRYNYGCCNPSKGKHMTEHAYTFARPPKPVGYWVLYAQATPTISFSMYHKPTRLQIWFTELLLGWKWRDA
jgi:hypothetical protein